ncbi:two-component system sensor histidine kinase DegS [Sinobaca qinghaiensis]|uniref:Signal transduction histidine-protein kinase/phosphatase DegS n=1 Tax=Sinobaca qinghaiensis TaxID=342944 RepID=A0A419V902_9BACL|nr:sensor histidine kinase [Sinobaca qinghaiensis]RKD76507.1 two-component system sensor histidine kinase DegS [Sinobaca qinghaiensis]
MVWKPALDEVVKKMLGTVDLSKRQLFDIGEQSRSEFDALNDELREIKKKVAATIEASDKMEIRARIARNRLAQMSRTFKEYSDKDVQNAYEKANALQVELAVVRQEEKQLRERRDYIERRLVLLQEQIGKAETLIHQVSVVYNFLDGDLKDVGELVANAKEKQRFSLKIIEAQEEERKKVAREIHDGPAQMLANVMLRSELVERVYNDKGIEPALEEIRDVRYLIQDSLAEVRRIIYDLRPMALDDLGLVPALRKYLQTVEERTGMTIYFRELSTALRLPPHVEIALFRLIQEAVQNTSKHAEADMVRVNLEVGNDFVTALIKDNGKGFETEKSKENSFGIVGMKERVLALNGEMRVQSEPGKGTTVIIKIPLE